MKRFQRDLSIMIQFWKNSKKFWKNSRKILKNSKKFFGQTYIRIMKKTANQPAARIALCQGPSQCTFKVCHHNLWSEARHQLPQLFKSRRIVDRWLCKPNWPVQLTGLLGKIMWWYIGWGGILGAGGLVGRYIGQGRHNGGGTVK